MNRLLHLLLLLLLPVAATHAATYSLPHTFTMSSTESRSMKIIDANNDGNKWAYEIHGNYNVMYILTDDNAADDWLILEGIRMKKNYITRMRYTMRSGSEDALEAYEIKAGTGTNVSNMTISVVPRTEYSTVYYTVYDAYISVPADGTYYIGFHAMSEKGCSAIVIDNVELTQGPLAELPLPVTGLAVTPQAPGSYNVDLQFTAPQKRGNGNALTSADIASISIMRDGTVIKTLTGIEPGASCLFTDVAPNGDHEYSVVVNGKNGSSDAIKQQVFVGYDTPFSPRSANATVQDDCVLISWDAVGDMGTHYHYVDPARITYNIYLYNEVTKQKEKVGTSLAGATTYRYEGDTDLGDQRMLLFSVEAADEPNNIVSARSTDTERVIVGKPYAMPYIEPMMADGDPYKWFTLETPIGSDGWSMGTVADEEERKVMGVKCAYPTSEAVISTGKIAIQGTDNPVLMFQYYLGAIAFNDEMEVSITRNDYPEPIAISVCERYNVPTSKWVQKSVKLKNFITPDTRWITVRFKAYGAPALQEGRDYQLLYDVRVADIEDGDLAVELLSASDKLPYNGAVNMSVKVENRGSSTIRASKYAVAIYKNGERVGEAGSVALQPFASAVIPVRYECCGPDEADNLNLEIRIEIDGDPYPENNSVFTDATLIRPALPKITALGKRDEGNNVVLTWNKLERTFENVNEDFESYDAFAIGEEVLTDYTIRFKPQATEKCGTGKYPHAGEAIGWLVFDNVKAGFGTTGAYAPHSGSQCLVAFDGAEQMDTWLITPELSGAAQTISFYTSALTGNGGGEQFNVLYSMQGMEKGDFIALNSKPLVETQSWDWTLREFSVPEGARHFAIQVITKDKLGFKLDDLSFERAHGTDLTVLAYKLYFNGVHTMTIPADSDAEAVLQPAQAGEVGVTVVTDWGEGEPVTVAVSPIATGISELVTEDASVIYDVMGRKVSVPVRGMYIKDGRKIVR